MQAKDSATNAMGRSHDIKIVHHINFFTRNSTPETDNTSPARSTPSLPAPQPSNQPPSINLPTPDNMVLRRSDAQQCHPDHRPRVHLRRRLSHFPSVRMASRQREPGGMVQHVVSRNEARDQGRLWVSVLLPHRAWVETFDLGYRGDVDESTGHDQRVVGVRDQYCRDAGIDVLVRGSTGGRGLKWRLRGAKGIVGKRIESADGDHEVDLSKSALFLCRIPNERKANGRFPFISTDLQASLQIPRTSQQCDGLIHSRLHLHIPPTAKSHSTEP
jgi:hypothetical protein